VTTSSHALPIRIDNLSVIFSHDTVWPKHLVHHKHMLILLNTLIGSFRILSISDSMMLERWGKQYLHPSSCGPRGGDSVLPVLKTLIWQWNLFYCYIHLSLLCEHDSLHKKWTGEHYINTTAHNMCWSEWFKPCTQNGQYCRPALVSVSRRHSKMQPYPWYFKM
jgi:hypothetical protein